MDYSAIIIGCIGFVFFIGILCTFLSLVLEKDYEFVINKPKVQPYHPYYDQSHNIDVIIIEDDTVSPT